METEFFGERRIAAKLQGVAESLLAVNEKHRPSPAFAMPLGLGKSP